MPGWLERYLYRMSSGPGGRLNKIGAFLVGALFIGLASYGLGHNAPWLVGLDYAVGGLMIAWGAVLAFWRR